MRDHLAKICWLMPLMGACLPDLVMQHGERVRYEHEADFQPCAGNVPYLDRLIRHLEQQLQISGPDNVRYSWITRDDYLPERFSPRSVDWVVGGHAFSSDPASVHEVVHLVSPGTTPFFREGLATAYSALGDGLRYTDAVDLDPRRTMTAKGSGGVDYPVAAFFVAFLVTRHGPAKFREFYGFIPQPPTMAGIRTAFRRAIGAELDDEVEVFMAGPPQCRPGDYSMVPEDCSAPLHAWRGGVWEIEERLDCDMSTVVGGVGPSFAYMSYQQFTLDVSEAGAYEIETAGDSNVWFDIGRCFGCLWDDPHVALEQDERLRVTLARGRHFVRALSPEGSEPAISIKIRRVGE